MKILANKEIKKSISFAFTGFWGYISLSRGFSMAIISPAFSVIANPFSIGWWCCMGSLLCIF